MKLNILKRILSSLSFEEQYHINLTFIDNIKDKNVHIVFSIDTIDRDSIKESVVVKKSDYQNKITENSKISVVICLAFYF